MTHMNTVHFVLSDTIRHTIQQQFLKESEFLQTIVPFAIIEHIGATAVPGLLTKGDLDINVRVQHENFLPSITELRLHYNTHQLENWSTTFASFQSKHGGIGIQLTVIDSADDFFICHRDMLRTNVEHKKLCNTLKTACEGMSEDIYRNKKSKLYDKIFK